MAAPMEQVGSRGLRSIQGAAKIEDHTTEVVCTEYENYLFILLTQVQKLGTLVEATHDVVLQQSTGTVTYSTKVLLGKDEPMMHVLARSLAAKIGGPKPILFGFAFKNTTAPVLRAAEELVMKHIQASCDS